MDSKKLRPPDEAYNSIGSFLNEMMRVYDTDKERAKQLMTWAEDKAERCFLTKYVRQIEKLKKAPRANWPGTR